ncbi:MAG: hypothetical protein C4532_19280 [Candidatus Abyssobacteria bacterium SURF_17]|uniref:FHA domain-containing protein n=1 Tax=Candidatus Abyssobacteria bacterium SURF_17 TaxID=2093361 RepID=A0A419ENP6_9BACT|nr:MAG: hypothetical protein C4532_19280 [Candidatus Abyssubacteria bacterium SURF_17]
MKKAFVAGLLILAIGFVLWQLITRELSHPTDQMAVRIDKERMIWFACPSCNKMFMAEETTKKGYCPYCSFETILVGDKKVLGKSSEGSGFVWFFSPNCGKFFLAYETKQAGKCPYCGEVIDLTAPPTTDLQTEPAPVVALIQPHAKKLLAAAIALFIISIAGIYVLLESRVVLSLKPIAGAASEEASIALSRRQVKKKKLTLGNAPDADIVVNDPALSNARCVLSFVRVGGKTHAYLRYTTNQPVWVNEKFQYNPHLKDHDKVKIGNIIFEVHAHGKRVS